MNIKEYLRFAFKVTIALVIINAVTDFVPALNAYIYTPLKALGLVKSS